jgi:SAM-dependent methyltransferase
MTDWIGLLDSWDQQQALYRPARAEALEVVASVAARLGSQDNGWVLDLACGCGSVTRGLLSRNPDLKVVAIDRDPVLLRVAAEVFHDDPRVALIEADLTTDWLDRLHGYDIRDVVSAASLHWFTKSGLRRLYADLATLMPPGAAFANLDWMLPSAPAVAGFASQAVKDYQRAQLARGKALTWRAWWSTLRENPELAVEFDRRDRVAARRSAELMATEHWHIEALRSAGFADAAVVWRSYNSAVLVAIR